MTHSISTTKRNLLNDQWLELRVEVFIIILILVPVRQRDVISVIFLPYALSLSFQELSFSAKMWEEGRSSA